MYTSPQLFVERRPGGDYAVKRAGAKRVSAIAPTQREAIERARELNPRRLPMVNRVRNTGTGVRNHWRRP